MKKLLELLQKKNLFSIAGMKTELGWKTKRCNLNDIKECEEWLKESDKNSLRLFFENEDFIDFTNIDL